MSLTVQSFFDTVYLPIVLSQSSGGHRYLAQCIVRKFDRWHKKETLVSELSDALISNYLRWLEDEEKASPLTRNRHRSYLLAIWRQAVRRGHAKEMPTLPRAKEKRKFPTAWTTAQIGTLLQSARMTPGEIGGVKASAWWFALFLVCYDTALRRRALLALRWSDINLEAKTVLANAEDMKDDEDKVCHLSDQTVEALKAICEPKRSLVFAWPFDLHKKRSWTTFHRRMLAIVLRAGLDADYKILQRIRRTSATLVNLKFPGAASAHLGQSDPTLAAKWYIDPRLMGDGGNFVDGLPRP